MMISSLLIVGTIGILRRYIPLSSALLAFFRGLIGAASLSVFFILFRKKKWQKANRRQLTGMVVNGAFLGVNWILLFEAFNYTTIAKATLSYYMQPTFLLLLSPLVFRERLTLKKILCAIAALAGMVFVSGVIGSGSSRDGELKGVACGLGAAGFYTLVVILNKKISGVDVCQKTIVQLFSAAVVLLPYLLITSGFQGVELNGKLILLLLIAGIVYTGVVYALYFGSMDGLKAQTISALSYIDPITAMAVSAAVFRESLPAIGVAGAFLILGAAIIGEMNIHRIR